MKKDTAILLAACLLTLGALAVFLGGEIVRSNVRNKHRAFEAETERMATEMRLTRENLKYAYPQGR